MVEVVQTGDDATMASTKVRIAWLDRFVEPKDETLVDSLNRQVAPAFEHARDMLKASGTLHETIAWQGVWNWTFTYTNGQPDKPVAYLVPDPVRPRLALAFPDHLIPKLTLKKLSKSVRDGLAHAPVVGAVRWAQWDIQSKAQIEEILTLVEARLAESRAVTAASSGS